MEEDKNFVSSEKQQETEENTQQQLQQIVDSANKNQQNEDILRKISIKDAFSFAWNVFKKNKKFILLLMLVYVLVIMVESILKNAVVKNATMLFIVNMLTVVVDIFMGIGFIKIFLKLSRGQEAKIEEIIGDGKYFWRFLGAYILYFLILLFGFILLIIPGIIWQIKYGYFAYLIIDKDMGPIQAIKESGKITYGFKWELFLLQLVMGLSLLCGLLLLGVGLLIAYPVVLLVIVYAYRTLVGERVEIRN
jgi:uncharacterized membrane protein